MQTGKTGRLRHLASIMGRDAVNREAVREENSRTGITETGRAAGSLSALRAKAGELKAAAARDIRIIKGVRRALLLTINLLIIAGAVLDRIAETKLPAEKAGRGKALVWMHRQLLQRRGRRTRNAAETRTETNAPERI